MISGSPPIKKKHAYDQSQLQSIRRKLLLAVPATLLASAWPVRGEGNKSEGLIQRVAFGSCAMQWKEQPIWDAVLNSSPDLFLFLGDAIYGDFDGKQVFTPTEESLKRDWGKLADISGFQRLRDKVPVIATWDNHDYGHHNAGEEFILKEASRKIFLDFFGEADTSPRRTQDGIYDAKLIGPPGKRVQLILLDTRWNRSPLIPDRRSNEQREALGLSGSMGHTPNPDPLARLLGEKQWQWLEEQLRTSAEIRLICSGTQIINDAKGMQEWGNFSHERKRLFQLIEQTRAQGVIFLSGNVHYSEVSRLDSAHYPLYDFTSSGMTHNNERYAHYQNPYRVAGPCVDNNFGLVEIDWQGKSTSITLKTIGLDKSEVFSYPIHAGNLQ